MYRVRAFEDNYQLSMSVAAKDASVAKQQMIDYATTSSD